jgi:hypothetical protein
VCQQRHWEGQWTSSMYGLDGWKARGTWSPMA